MKKKGIALTIIGFIGILLAFGFDTTVLTDSGSRVQNIGLMQLQNNLILLAIALFLGGLILWSVAGLASKSSDRARETALRDQQISHTDSLPTAPILAQSSEKTAQQAFNIQIAFDWIQKPLSLPVFRVMVTGLRFLETHRRLVAAIILVSTVLVVRASIEISGSNFSNIARWMTLFSLLLAIYYFSTGVEKPRRYAHVSVASTSESQPHTMSSGSYNVNMVESTIRLLVVLLFLWNNDDYLGRFDGRTFASFPLIILFTIGLFLRKAGVTLWSTVAMTVSIVLGLSQVWQMIARSTMSIEDLISNTQRAILEQELTLPLPWGFDWGLLFLLFSVIWPSLNGVKFLGYRFGSHRLDFRLRSHRFGEIVVPLYSAFVYGSVTAGLYYSLRILILHLT